MSDMEKSAKMSVLKDLKQQANEALGGKLKGMKKVSVLAKDEEGLEKGLDKAKEIVGGMEEMSEESEDQEEMGEEESDESEDKPGMDYSNMSEEELQMHKDMIEKCLMEKMKE
jgi:hypothetical protein